MVLLVSVFFLMCLSYVSLQSASRCNLPVGWQPLSYWLILQQATSDFSLGGDGRGEKGDKGREKRKRGWRKGRRKIRPLSSRLSRTKIRICTASIVFHLNTHTYTHTHTSQTQISEVGKLISLTEGRSFKIKLYGYKRSLTGPSLQPIYHIYQPTQNYLLKKYIYMYIICL